MLNIANMQLMLNVVRSEALYGRKLRIFKIS